MVTSRRIVHFWSQLKDDAHCYTLVANIRVWDAYQLVWIYSETLIMFLFIYLFIHLFVCFRFVNGEPLESYHLPILTPSEHFGMSTELMLSYTLARDDTGIEFQCCVVTPLAVCSPDPCSITCTPNDIYCKQWIIFMVNSYVYATILTNMFIFLKQIHQVGRNVNYKRFIFQNQKFDLRLTYRTPWAVYFIRTDDPTSFSYDGQLVASYQRQMRKDGISFHMWKV